VNNLLDGIYQVTFKSNLADFGSGLIVAQNGTIHGGDHSYLYVGTYSSYESSIKAKINVKHYRGSLDSIFGALNSFSLELKGSGTNSQFTLEGNITLQPNLKINLVCTKVSSLVSNEF
jgi:hypothetical protein